jgi:hypothetical protein
MNEKKHIILGLIIIIWLLWAIIAYMNLIDNSYCKHDDLFLLLTIPFLIIVPYIIRIRNKKEDKNANISKTNSKIKRK